MALLPRGFAPPQRWDSRFFILPICQCCSLPHTSEHDDMILLRMMGSLVSFSPLRDSEPNDFSGDQPGPRPRFFVLPEANSVLWPKSSDRRR